MLAKKQKASDNYWYEKSKNFSDQYQKEKTSFWQRFVQNFLDKRFKIISRLIEGNINSDSVVIDIGCGSGVYIKQAALFNPKEIIGIDYSDQMLETARTELAEIRKGKEIRLIRGGADKLDLKDSSGDLILAIGLFDYLKKPELALAEISRVLKKDGRAIVCLPKKYSPLGFLRYWPGLLLRKYLLKLPPILNSWSRKEASNFFNQFNLTPVNIYQVQKTMWIFELRK